jgi:hypothetical protein
MKFVFYFILKISISFGKHIRKDLPVVPIQNFQPPTEQIDLSASNEVPFSKSFEEHLNFHDSLITVQMKITSIKKKFFILITFFLVS